MKASQRHIQMTLIWDGLKLKIDKVMFGLLGPNGPVKSTLMITIVTLQEPDFERIIFKLKEKFIKAIQDPNHLMI